MALVGGIGDKQEVTASGDEHRGSGTARLEQVGGDTCEGAGEDDGAVGASSQVDEVGESTLPAREGSVGVKDEQDDMHLVDELLDEGQVAGEGDGPLGTRVSGGGFADMTEGHDEAFVSAEGVHAGQDGVAEGVVGREEQHGALRTGGAIGPGTTGGDVDGERESEEAGATGGRAVQQGEFALGETTGPQPAQGLQGRFGWGRRDGW